MIMIQNIFSKLFSVFIGRRYYNVITVRAKSTITISNKNLISRKNEIAF